MTSDVEAPKDILRRLVAERRSEHLTYVADAIGDFPLDRADLFSVFDVYGNKFLDLSAGDGVMVIGHYNPGLVSAVQHHLQHHVHTARSGMHVSPRVTEYAKAISSTFPVVNGQPQQVLFCPSEIEARLYAVALARAVTGRRRIVSLEGQPPPPSNEMKVVTEGRAIPSGSWWDDSGAVMLSLVNPDMSPVDQVWARMLAEAAERNDALAIIDETVTGYGRTGSLWMHQQWGIDGDITILGGAGGGGFPFGAVVAGPDLFAAYRPPQRLFGASPVICQAGLCTLEYLDGALLEHAVELGEVFAEGVRELHGQFPDLVSGSCGIGLARGLIMSTAEVAQTFYREAFVRGLMVRLPVRDCVIPITPPLVIFESELRRAIDAMASICLDWSGPL